MTAWSPRGDLRSPRSPRSTRAAEPNANARMGLCKHSTNVSGGHTLLQIRVDKLFDGRLGIRLGDHLVVTGLDRPEAKALGWRTGDVILKANGNNVRDRDELRNEIKNAWLPMSFVVARLSGGAVAGYPITRAASKDAGPTRENAPVCIRRVGDEEATEEADSKEERFDSVGARGQVMSRNGRTQNSTHINPKVGDMPQAGDEWFAFVGAKVLVMSDKGCTLPCTVIEVEEDRVKVHDDSGELKDKWLPKHSTLIHPDIHHDHLDYDVDDPFDFVGAKVLVMSGKGHPLPCTVVEVDEARVKVRDNAHEFDDEWLPKNSSHINPKGGGILEVGDDIDEWLSFVGAKILVMGDKGHTVPCTVIEVEESRVKVHDESGEMKDKWLPKHSPHIHPDLQPAEVEYAVDDPFDFVGAKVLVMSGKGHPLPCIVVEVDGDNVKVRDNAHEFADEWLPKNSTHINPKGGGMPQAGDDIDAWFAFVGAKVLVMSDKGCTLPCTVIEVEEDRVKVHDDSGELKDKWLPKHSTHIHPDIHHDHLDYDVDDPFDFVGAKVLVMSGKGHPLPCTVVEVDEDNVKVSDNAHEFADEWLPKNSTHINPKGGGILEVGDDIDEWLSFVGAKILVMGDKGHTVPCTVIEVEENRVKVHDDSGEMKDKWLPKHSPHIHPEEARIP